MIQANEKLKKSHLLISRSFIDSLSAKCDFGDPENGNERNVRSRFALDPFIPLPRDPPSRNHVGSGFEGGVVVVDDVVGTRRVREEQRTRFRTIRNRYRREV